MSPDNHGRVALSADKLKLFGRCVDSADRLERPRESGPEQSGRIHDINCKLIKISALLCSIDLIDAAKPRASVADCVHGELDNVAAARQVAPREGCEPSAHEESLGRPRKSWSTRVFQVLQLYCFAHMSLNLFCQYQYDIWQLRLRRQAADNTTCAADEQCRPEALAKLNTTVALYRDLLRSIGAPHMDSNFTIGYFYSTILLFTLMLYAIPQFYSNFVSPFDFCLVRQILNADGERESCETLVDRGLCSLLKSSKTFADNSSDSDWNVLSKLPVAREPQQSVAIRRQFAPGFERPHCLGSKANTIRLQHLKTCNQLRGMRTRGALWPINRRPEWTADSQRTYCFLHLAGLVYAFCLDMVFVGALLALTRKTGRLSWADLQMVVNIACLITIDSVSCILFNILLVGDCLDQIRLVCRLRSLVRGFIGSSQRRLQQAAIERQLNVGRPSYPGGAAEQLAWQLNRELLYIVMQFKTFLAQLAPLKRSFRFVPMVMVSVPFVSALLGRLHVAYIDETFGVSFRLVAALFSFVCLLFFDICLMIPLSYLNSRCLDLFRSLDALLAHLLAIQSGHTYDGRLAADSPRPFYEHTLVILIKELGDPNVLSRQFAFVSGGITFDYSNFIRIHFWFGLLVFSMVVRTDSHPSGLLHRMAHDPLNVL